MNYELSPLIESVHYPPISEVRNWAADYKNADRLPLIDLCQAVPDYAPAKELTDYISSIVSDPLTARYTPDEGLLQAREALAARYKRLYGASISPEKICLTVGASQAFWLAMMALCKAGDEVIVQTPYYFDHDMGLAMLGITRVYAPFCPDNGGVPSVESIFRLVTDKTKAIILVTPSNPTGVVTPPEVLEELYTIAEFHGIALILDETYADFIISENPPHNILQKPDWSNNFIQIMSLGKTYSLTGYRAGLLLASEGLIHHALKAQDTMVVCQPRITQMALGFAADNLDSWVKGNASMMAARHEIFCEEFARPGNPFELVASGSFFGWVRQPFTGLTGRQAAKKLVEEAGLLTLPGEVFGPGFEGYLRLALGNIGAEMIPEAVRRLREYK